MAKSDSVSKVKKTNNKKEASQENNSVAQVAAPVSVPTTADVAAPVPAVAASAEPVPVVTEQLGSSAAEKVEVVEEAKNEEESNIELLFNKFLVQFQDIQAVLKTMHSNLKVLQKEVMRERKEYKKKESKIKKKSEKKKNPSGFAKPGAVSPELAAFLNLAPGEEIARTEATAKIIAYVKEHNLQNPANKRQILPDAKLAAILQPGNEIVKFFNLQTFLKKHFISNKTPETTSSPSVV